MKRTTLIAGVALVAVAATSVIATAHDRGGKFGGPEAMIEKFDANGDGAITKAEIQEAAAARFAQADTNGDGVLSAEEMTAAAQARSAKATGDRVAKRIEKLDTNGDGQLSLDEMQARGTERLDRMFDRADADGDGTLTLAELQEMKSKFGRHGKRGDDGANNE